MVIKPPEEFVLEELSREHPSLAWLSEIPAGQVPDFILCSPTRKVIELAGLDDRISGYRGTIRRKVLQVRA